MSRGVDKTAVVSLTAGEIDELFDAIDEQMRHWSDCGGSDEENDRYDRTIAVLRTIGRKLDAARDNMEDE